MTVGAEQFGHREMEVEDANHKTKPAVSSCEFIARPAPEPAGNADPSGWPERDEAQ